ncbi:MAG: FAD-dependent oxidoreductase [Crocinitomix sp.]|nr:FAD-dependent oxidoreductase [Crocinitomix sp.]
MLEINALSYWEKETYINHTDFLVIGSGIVGLSTAIHIKERNPSKKVTVLERGYLPTGASTKNAGFACIGSPSELLADLEKQSEEIVFDTVQKRWQGLNYLRELLGDEAIEYKEFGSYELFTTAQEASYQACLKRIDYLNSKLNPITGIQKVFLAASKICKSAEFNNFKYAIKHAAEGQINTGKMMAALLKLAQSKGIHILNGIEAKEIQNQKLLTNIGSFKFNKLAVCTNGFAKTLLPKEDVSPARAQVLVTSPIENLPFLGIYHFDEGYYYFRNIGNRVLFGGGRNLDIKGETTTKLETTEQITDHLEKILRENILPNCEFTIEYKWAGTMGVGKSKSPIIKKLSEHVYCGVRLGGMGVAIGTLVGKELAYQLH